MILSACALAVLAAGCGGDSSTGTTPTTPAAPTGPVVTLSPTLVTFTTATGGPQNVSLTNTGIAALQITSIAAVGNFDQTNDCPTSLDVGANCTIRVTFVPRTVAGASSSGALTIADNAPNSPQAASLVGPGVTTATGRLSPASLTFGSQAIGTTSAAQVVTLSNLANGAATVAMTIFSIEASGDFRVAQTSCGSSLIAGNSCTISVVFAPTASGDRAGTLTVLENAPVSVLIIPLNGTGR